MHMNILPVNFRSLNPDDGPSERFSHFCVSVKWLTVRIWKLSGCHMLNPPISSTTNWRTAHVTVTSCLSYLWSSAQPCKLTGNTAHHGVSAESHAGLESVCFHFAQYSPMKTSQQHVWIHVQLLSVKLIWTELSVMRVRVRVRVELSTALLVSV